ncbi:MAG: glycosyltransferase family 2 protein [Proteobacteria bacterium]|nr:glycosyltransferase family 2 protein [Pseudomonadota bacterium]
MSLPISVIVTTYNWPQALARVLNALSIQNYRRMEVIVADDGSNDLTAQVINTYRQQCDFPVIHCWQPDEGFRAAMCRNKAVAKANHPYLVFIDGDCIPFPHFVANHAKLAQAGWFVAGNRVLLSQSFTQTILNQELKIEKYKAQQWLRAVLTGRCNRLAPYQYFPLGKIRTWRKHQWAGAKTCNLGMWRQDFINVNGFDENFVGWGFEDSDLVIRLLRHGCYKKLGKFAVEVCHLWHLSQNKAQLSENKSRLKHTLQCSQVKAVKGIEQYLIYENNSQT